MPYVYAVLGVATLFLGGHLIGWWRHRRRAAPVVFDVDAVDAALLNDAIHSADLSLFDRQLRS